MKFKEYDENSPGFIGRARKRLAVFEAGNKYIESQTLADEVAYFDAIVDLICEYVDASKEEVEKLSSQRLMVVYEKLIDHIKEKSNPKDSDNSGSG